MASQLWRAIIPISEFKKKSSGNHETIAGTVIDGNFQEIGRPNAVLNKKMIKESPDKPPRLPKKALG